MVDSCTHHHALGYLLACSTYPSSGVVQRLESITANLSNPVIATFWDAVRIEQMLSFPRGWSLAQRFFPESANRNGWQVYATERSNRWIATYKGYYFHLTNRIGSSNQIHLPSVSNRINDIEAIKLPDQHTFRVRAVYYDDKNGNYRWYVDYLRPKGESPSYDVQKIKRMLGDENALEDGQWYSFDVVLYEYRPTSDHHDADHYRYYEPYLECFLVGLDRSDS